MSDAIVLFTRDLRVHDHAALTAATTEHEHVIPLFASVHDPWRAPLARVAPEYPAPLADVA